jgi:hypothetical protein
MKGDFEATIEAIISGRLVLPDMIADLIISDCSLLADETWDPEQNSPWDPWYWGLRWKCDEAKEGLIAMARAADQVHAVVESRVAWTITAPLLCNWPA